VAMPAAAMVRVASTAVVRDFINAPECVLKER
jgi:hypothetical protein